jgi:ribosomal protein L37AE/L43A
MRSSSLMSRQGLLVCPLCEAGELSPFGRDWTGCSSCGGSLGGALLQTLRQVAGLPDALGSHACEECGHPEMRLLPDGVYWCPACGSEVLPLASR